MAAQHSCIGDIPRFIDGHLKNNDTRNARRCCFGRVNRFNTVDQLGLLHVSADANRFPLRFHRQTLLLTPNRIRTACDEHARQEKEN